MNTYLVVSSFLVAVISLFFIVSVLLKRVWSRRNVAFCIFAVSVFVWITGHMLWQLSDSAEQALFWVRVLVCGSAVIPYSYLHFVSEVTGSRNNKLVAFGYLLAAILCGFAFTPAICVGVKPRMSFDFWPVAGWLFPVYFGGFVAVVVYCYFLLIRQYKHAPSKVKNQNKYLIIGTAVGFFGGATNFPLWMNIPIPPFGHGLSIFYILGIGYSVLKYRLLDFNEMAIRLLGVLAVSIGAGSALSFGLLRLMESVGSEYSPQSYIFWWSIFSFVGLVFLISSPLISRVLNDILEMRFIAGRFAYRDELRNLSDAVLSRQDEEDVFQLIVSRTHSALALDFSCLYARSDLASGFESKAFVGRGFEGGQHLDAARLEPLIELVRGTRHAIFLEEEMERSVGFQKSVEILLQPDLPFRKSDVFVPIAVQDTLYGFLVLGASSRSGAFSDVDLLLLENLCGELAFAMKSREMERMSNQVEKLVSLGTMAAGLSHELRNPLVSVRTMTSLLKRNPTELKLTEDFSATVQRDVKRIFGIVEGVSAFAQDAKRPMETIAISDVIFEAQSGVSGRLELENVQLEVVLDKDIPSLHADLEQLIQVVRNIIENGINAISEWSERPELGMITLRASLCGGGRFERKRWIEIDISDNGPGIPRDLQNRIFDPFVTSRDTGARHGSAGTGLGLAIVSKIIERHQGHITVSSELNHGTCFRISLPCE